MASNKQSPFPSFRTLVEPANNPKRVSHTSTIINIGSCFSEHIGEYLEKFKFRICINPTGILYNPSSICQALLRLLSGNSYLEDELFHYDGLWKSFDHHSDFNTNTSQKCLEKINSALEKAREYINKLDTLIITFGTSFVYYKKDTNRIVANCHKLPHDTFVRKLMPISSIVSDYSRLFNTLYTQLPDLNLIVTVSPIRHLRDNPHENQVSKAHLMAAINTLQEKFPQLYYFPSYEIIMDELRDYRFYTSDMVHPSNVAIRYIWQKFILSCIDEKSTRFISQYEPVLQAQNHLIKDPSSKSTRHFATLNLDKIGILEKEFQGISLSKERNYFNGLLKK